MTRPDSEGQAGRPPAGRSRRRPWRTGRACSGCASGRRPARAGDRSTNGATAMRMRRRMERAHRQVELDNILARVRAGVWRKREPPAAASCRRAVPDLPRVRVGVAAGKIAGVLGDRPIDANTEADYRWRLTRHLLPFFGQYRWTRSTASCASRSRRTSCGRPPSCGARSPRARSCATVAGAASGRSGPASIRKLIDCLAASSTRRSRTAHRPQPSAREAHAGQGAQAAADVPRDGRARRAHRRRRRAGRADRARRSCRHAEPGSTRAPKVAGAAAAGHALRATSPPSSGSPRPPSATTWSARRSRRRRLRRAAARSSPRWRQRHPRQRAVRPPHRATSAFTPRGRALPHPRRQDRGRRPRGPDEPRPGRGVRRPLRSPAPRRPPDRPRRLRCSRTPRGGRITRQRVAAIVGEAATLRLRASSAARGLPPLPNTTPHTLRRTYISIALLANRFDVLWVMGQVGHADSKMTLDVYAQLQQRVEREHGGPSTPSSAGAASSLYGTASERPEAAPSPI